jgi:hypothetical protein
MQTILRGLAASGLITVYGAAHTCEIQVATWNLGWRMTAAEAKI